MSNVIEHKGSKHSIMEAWIEEHNYKIHYIECDYNNSNYHKNSDKNAKTIEVLVTNY